MALLIDGYNLLHATGIFGLCQEDDARHARRLEVVHPGPSSFQRSREALLRFLAASIEPDELSRTTIVFDAAGAPSGLPGRVKYQGMTVLYSRDYPDADAQIEQLIEEETAPRLLMVVSSDHRVQRAARRRRARYIDSDRWYARLWKRRHARQQRSEPVVKPTGPFSAEEIEYWLREFSQPLDTPEKPEQAIPESPAQDNRTEPTPPNKSDPSEGPPLENPFPPGYGEDLLEEDRRSD